MSLALHCHELLVVRCFLKSLELSRYLKRVKNMRLRQLVEEYFKNSTLHGAKFIVDKDASWIERLFWTLCLVASWLASWQLIKVSLGTYLHFQCDMLNRSYIFINSVSTRCFWAQCHQFCGGEFLSGLGHQFPGNCCLWIEKHGSHTGSGGAVSVKIPKRICSTLLIEIFTLFTFLPDSGAPIMISHWRKCLAKFHSFVANLITPCMNVAVRSRRKTAFTRISRITLNWCAAVVRTRYKIVCGMTRPLNVVNTSIAWKRNWAFVMPSTPYKRGVYCFFLIKNRSHTKDFLEFQ